MVPLLALVVDDDRTIRYTLRAILEHAGLEVREAANGLEGLAELDRHAFALVITDLRMPRMCGLEMMEAIRRRPLPHPKIIVVVSNDADRRSVASFAPFATIRNPFAVEEIMVVVARVGVPV